MALRPRFMERVLPTHVHHHRLVPGPRTSGVFALTMPADMPPASTMARPSATCARARGAGCRCRATRNRRFQFTVSEGGSVLQTVLIQATTNPTDPNSWCKIGSVLRPRTHSPSPTPMLLNTICASTGYWRRDSGRSSVSTRKPAVTCCRRRTPGLSIRKSHYHLIFPSRKAGFVFSKDCPWLTCVTGLEAHAECLHQNFCCQMNERDSEAVAAQLVAKGYTLGRGEAEADVILLNTCSVRDYAEQKAFGKMEISRRTCAGTARMWCWDSWAAWRKAGKGID